MAYMISHVTGNKTATAHPYSALYVLRERTQQHKNANSYLEGFYLNHQWGLSFSLASVKISNHSICFSVHAIFFVLSQERSPTLGSSSSVSFFVLAKSVKQGQVAGL